VQVQTVIARRTPSCDAKASVGRAVRDDGSGEGSRGPARLPFSRSANPPATSFQSFCLVGWLVLLASLSPILLYAQGSVEDYERSARRAGLSRNKVFRTDVQPTWFPEGKGFWYRVETGPDRHEFVLVDGERGARLLGFDHDQLASRLSDVLERDIQPEKLPFRTIEFSPDREEISFAADGKYWKYRVDSGELEEASEGPSESTLPRGRTPRPSRNGGQETNVTFVNDSSGEVELFWLDTTGNRRSYGFLEAGQQRAQPTYAGHVWLVVDQGEEVRGVFEAVAGPSIARVDDDPPPEETRNRRPRRGTARRSNADSADAKWRAFIRDDNVWLRDRETDETVQLSRDGSEEDPYQADFHWSPDSKKLVVMQVKQGERRRISLVEAAPRDQLQPRLHELDYAKPGDELPVPRPRLFDIGSAEPVRLDETLFPHPWSSQRVRWWPESDAFTFIYNQRGHQVLRVIEVDAESGDVRALIDEQSDTFIDYAHKQFTHFLDEPREILWMSERDGWNHLYRVDARTGEVLNQITTGEWVVRGVERVDEEARQIWFRAGGIHADQDPYHVHFVRVDLDGANQVCLTEGDGTHELEFSPDGKFIVDRYSRVDLPPVTELRRVEDGSLVCELERGDWSRLLETGWQVPERMVAKGRDGETDIHGVIFRPTRFDPEGRYPVIEQIYAGPQGAFVPKRFAAHHRHQSLAELGFIVVQIDGMGTSYRSKAFHDVCAKDLADSGFPDRILWFREAAERVPQMDLGRVGIYGGSAGGQSALRAVLAHGDFYHAAAADCGCHDNRMDKVWWNELWMGWPVGSHYEEQSNVTNAHLLNGKLLLTVGAMDRNVDPASTMQVVEALIRAEKDFELIVFPSGGHGVGESEYGRRRREDFFVRNLLGVEPRWSGQSAADELAEDLTDGDLTGGAFESETAGDVPGFDSKDGAGGR
jgi:dipeptidyl-peptidase 4